MPNELYGKFAHPHKRSEILVLPQGEQTCIFGGEMDTSNFCTAFLGNVNMYFEPEMVSFWIPSRSYSSVIGIFMI